MKRFSFLAAVLAIALVIASAFTMKFVDCPSGDLYYYTGTGTTPNESVLTDFTVITTNGSCEDVKTYSCKYYFDPVNNVMVPCGPKKGRWIP